MIKSIIDVNKISTLSSKRELKVTIKVIEQEKIQMTQKMTSKEIVRKTRDVDAEQRSRKNILTARCHSEEVIVLKVSNEESRKALRSDEE